MTEYALRPTTKNARPQLIVELVAEFAFVRLGGELAVPGIHPQVGFVGVHQVQPDEGRLVHRPLRQPGQQLFDQQLVANP